MRVGVLPEPGSDAFHQDRADHRVEEGCGAGYAIWGALSTKQLQQVRPEKRSPPSDNAAHFGEPTASDVSSERDAQ